MFKPFALGIVCQNRWNYTLSTLNSIFFSDQDKKSYDIFLIDNGSSKENVKQLREHISKFSLLPIKNTIFLPEVSMSKAWNLFLCIARNYEHRVKYDNDLVLRGTIVPSESLPSPRQIPTSLLVGGSNPGAPVSGPPLRGLGQIGVYPVTTKVRSVFLDHMESFGRENNVDIVALVPVSPKETFIRMYTSIIERQQRGLPYLFGACMMISKKCFRKIGYFNEQLPRQIDMEYTQRAVRNQFNIGYHPYYYVTHIGATNPTELADVIQKKYQEAARIQDAEKVECYGLSSWEREIKKLDKALAEYPILNLS